MHYAWAARRATGGRSPATRREAGYSVTEMVAVIAIIAIMIGVSLWSFVDRRKAYAGDDTATQILDVLREANQRAVSERQPMRVELDRANRTMIVVDENGAGTGDDKVVRSETMLDAKIVAIRKATGGGMPAAPAAPYDAAAVDADAQFSSDVWKVRFLSNGSAQNTGASPAPQTSVFYVWQPPAGSPAAAAPADAKDIRAVTIFGPTAAIKLWRWDGAAWAKR